MAIKTRGWGKPVLNKKPRGRTAKKPMMGPFPAESSIKSVRAKATPEERRRLPQGSGPTAKRVARYTAQDRATALAVRAVKRQRTRQRELRRSKPKTYRGRPTAGAPTLGELRRSERSGTLGTNRKGFATTPKVRRAAKALHKAQASAPRAAHDVGGIEDPEIRKAIIKYAPRVDALARSSYGISGEALLSKLVKGESNEDQGAVSSASAKSITQFIPDTREDFVTRLGVDPWRSKTDAIKAATMHLDGKHGYSPGLEGYNPGGGQGYVDYILSQPVGDTAKAGRKVTPRLRKAQRQAKAAGLRVAGGQAAGPVPKKVMTRFKAAMSAAKELEKAKLPYVWGGGHGDPESRPTGGGLDCSGAVSYVLNKMGAMKGSLVSGDMGSVLEPGPGAVTVFYNAGHTFMRIGKRYFGTSRSNAGGGPGFIDQPDLSSYNVGHVPGMGRKIAVQMGLPVTEGGIPSMPGIALSDSGTTATITGGVTKNGAPGFSSKPIRLTPTQKAQRTMRKLNELGVGQQAKATEGKPTKLKELERRYGRGAV